MKQNEHFYDRLVRVLAALAVGALFLMGQISGIAALILGVIAVAFVITGFVGFCPVYHFLGLSTGKKQNPSAV